MGRVLIVLGGGGGYHLKMSVKQDWRIQRRVVVGGGCVSQEAEDCGKRDLQSALIFLGESFLCTE